MPVYPEELLFKFFGDNLGRTEFTLKQLSTEIGESIDKTRRQAWRLMKMGHLSIHSNSGKTYKGNNLVVAITIKMRLFLQNHGYTPAQQR